ncbi:PAS domain S-box protein [Maribacter algicola]|uniref:histidine kinase n=1 Tax=Maribacter algicola TaxID=2498892 RepID=A0A426RFK2_9FLAO|nr:PAS domain S-box protein [Maribacter algicola]RRQ47744.1 PAS domain S-box protein [Maribacter algicola]
MLLGPQIRSTSYLIKQLPTLTVFIDCDFRIIHASDKWLSTFGESSNAIFGRNLFEIFPDLSIKWQSVLKECFNGKSNPMGVQKFRDTFQKEKWYEWSNNCWYDEGENIIGAIIQIIDVTEAIENELELEKTKLQLKQQSEISKTGRWEYNIINDTVEWCETTKAIHEVNQDYVPKLDTSIQFYKEGYSRNAISMAIFEAQEKGTPWSLKLQIITASGKEKWVLAAGKPIYEKRKLIGFTGTFQDIDEQVLANIEIKKSEKLLRTLIDNLPLNVYVKDTNSKKVLVNKAECLYLGSKNESELLGKDNFDIYDYETAKKLTEQDIKVMSSLEPILGEEVVSLNKKGMETTFLTSKIPLLDERGKANGLIGISVDITNIKQKEKELRNLIDVTSLQNKKLINFAHIVSHNLRSHTANFSMLLDFLQHEENEEEKTKLLRMLNCASGSLLETIENLNEVLAINTNVNLEKKVINLHDKVNNVAQNLEEFITENNAHIINNIFEDRTLKVIPQYLDSILINFITNGIKYKHPNRQPKISLDLLQKENQSVLIIEDNGLGIDLKKYGNKLFGMYKTFHSHENARGMGLYITKNQIEAMGGKVEVESKVGVGTTFKIFFNEEN